MSFWTDENFAEAVRLRGQGHSSAEICKRIGAASRNAVIGRFHRAGIFTPREPAKPRPLRPAKEETIKLENILPPIVYEDGPVDGLTIMQLRPFHAEITSCRWPIGGTGAEMKFCGRNTRGKPYCRVCKKLAFNPMTGKQKASSNRGALWAATR